MKRALTKIGTAIGAYGVAKVLSRKVPRILMYHRFDVRDSERAISPDTLERHLQILRERFTIVSLQTLCSRLLSGEHIGANLVILTIDDGYEDFYRYAFPVFQKYSVPATLYVVTDFVDGTVWLWPDIIEYVFQSTSHSRCSIDLGREEFTFNLLDEDGKKYAWRTVASHCMTLNRQARTRLIEGIANELKVQIPSEPIAKYRALSWKQLRKMANSGIEIGSHTCTHSRLVTLSMEDATHEIQHSKVRIESMIDCRVNSLAYPFGKLEDYNDEVKGLVQDAGYSSAATAYFDDRATDDLFALRRLAVGSDVAHFKETVYGVRMLSERLSQRRSNRS